MAMKMKVMAALLTAGSVAAAGAAWAATASDTITVTATVANFCSVSVDDNSFAFSTLSQDTGTAAQSATVTLTCNHTPTTPALTVTSANADNGNFRMQKGTDSVFITYNVYPTLDGSGTAISSGGDLTLGTPTNNVWTAPISAIVPSTDVNALAAGDYTDTLTIEITY